jgi:hypothetical protein
MPNYIFDCQSCGKERNLGMSISEYKEMSLVGFHCSCGSKLSQRFGFLSSNVKKRSEEILEDIKEESRQIIKKINEGDIHTVREIYGESENKHSADNYKTVDSAKSFKRTS